MKDQEESFVLVFQGEQARISALSLYTYPQMCPPEHHRCLVRYRCQHGTLQLKTGASKMCVLCVCCVTRGYVYICICVYPPIFMCICMCACVCMCVYVCMYLRMCILVIRAMFPIVCNLFLHRLDNPQTFTNWTPMNGQVKSHRKLAVPHNLPWGPLCHDDNGQVEQPWPHGGSLPGGSRGLIQRRHRHTCHVRPTPVCHWRLRAAKVREGASTRTGYAG